MRSTGSLTRLVALALAGALTLLGGPARADDPPAAPAPVEAPKPEKADAKAEDAKAEPAKDVKAGAAEIDPEKSGDAKDAPPKAPRPAKKRRGGIHPCMTPDPGWGVYDKWSPAPSIGLMTAPQKGGVTKNGGFDLVVHFHGHEPARKEFVKTAKGIVFVGVTLGIGSGVYSQTFGTPQAFDNLIKSVEKEMAKRSGNPNAHVRKLALEAWSAGYGAIEQILQQPWGKKVDSVILLDGLHASYENAQTHSIRGIMLEPFLAFAKRAAAGKALMYVSHSSIIPPGYASTTETAEWLISQLKGKPQKATKQDVLGLDMISKYDKGGFHVRGYTGDDKPDHCAHLGLVASVVKSQLNPRWSPPKGTKLPAAKEDPKAPDAAKAAPKKGDDKKKPAAPDKKKGDDKKSPGKKSPEKKPEKKSSENKKVAAKR